MKGFLILVALISAVFYIYYPFVSKQKTCYDATQKSYNDIGYSVASRGLGLDEMCKRRTEVLMELEECVRKSDGSSVVAKYSGFFIEGVVSLIRPVAKGLQTLKSEHNSECSEYSIYQLE